MRIGLTPSPGMGSQPVPLDESGTFYFFMSIGSIPICARSTGLSWVLSFPSSSPPCDEYNSKEGWSGEYATCSEVQAPSMLSRCGRGSRRRAEGPTRPLFLLSVFHLASQPLSPAVLTHGLSVTLPEKWGPHEIRPRRKAETDRVREGISEGFRVA